MSHLKDRYEKEAVPKLIETFKYKNHMQVPKLKKVVLNMGVGEAVGKSMRASLVVIQFVVLFASLALYGTNPNFNLTV